MEEGLNKLPEIKKALESISRLKNISWPEYKNNTDHKKYLKKIESIIYSEFDIILNIIKPMNPKNFTIPIFRVREVDSFTDINLFTEHSYPPINLTRLGRCNFPKHPVFYGSDNAMTALIEVVRNTNYKKRKFCVSRWELIDIDDFFFFQTFLHSKLHKKNIYKILSENEFEQINKPFKNKLDKGQEKGLKEYLKYLNSLFINDNNYGVSASLAHRTLYAKNNYATDILMYPSVQTRFKGINLAIHPNFVDNRMQIKRFYIVELEDYNIEKDNFKMSFTKYADVDKNVIMWKDITPKDKLYKKYFSSDFKSMIQDDTKWIFK